MKLPHGRPTVSTVEVNQALMAHVQVVTGLCKADQVVLHLQTRSGTAARHQNPYVVGAGVRPLPCVEELLTTVG